MRLSARLAWQHARNPERFPRPRFSIAWLRSNQAFIDSTQ